MITTEQKTHELKTDPIVFDAVVRGVKTHEIRFNDRGFAIGDLLNLRETVATGEAMRAGAPLAFTGRATMREVSHIQTGYGLTDGWCILSFSDAEFERAKWVLKQIAELPKERHGTAVFMAREGLGGRSVALIPVPTKKGDEFTHPIYGKGKLVEDPQAVDTHQWSGTAAWCAFYDPPTALAPDWPYMTPLRIQRIEAIEPAPFQRETSPSCTDCCAKAGEPHTCGKPGVA